MDVVGELDFGHRPQAVHGCADRHPGYPELGEGRIDDPVLAELLEQSVGGPEDAAVHPNVLAEDNHARIDRHLLEQCLADGLDQGQNRHQRLSRAARKSGMRTPA